MAILRVKPQPSVGFSRLPKLTKLFISYYLLFIHIGEADVPRAWFSGRTSAFQAEGASSILAARFK